MLTLFLCAVAAFSPPLVPAGDPPEAIEPTSSAARESAQPGQEPESPEEPEEPAVVEAPAVVEEPVEAPAAVEAPAEPEEPKPAEEPKPKKPKKLKVKVQARVVAGTRLVHQEPALDSSGTPVGLAVRKGSIDLRQARVGVDLRYRKILQVRVSAELSDLLDTPKAGMVLRNAWANVAIHPAFQIRVGNFKRSYSRLELRGFSSIPFIGRGLFNGFAVEDLRWGDRALGMAMWGDIEPERPGLHRLRWQVGVSNHAISGAPHGFDVHARLVYDPLEWLSIGVDGAFKSVQDALADEATCRSTWTRGPSCRRRVFAAGGDLTFDVKGFYASAELNLAQDWTYADDSPWVLGALGYASYDIEVGKRTRLQPVVFGEYIDTNSSFAESEAVRAGANFNVLWTKHLRIIPQVEFIAPLTPVTAFNRFVPRQTYALWIAVQL